MEKRKCSVCKIEKLETDFSFRNKSTNTRTRKCKECHNKYLKTHYQKNREKYIAKAKADRPNQDAKRAALRESLKTPCVNCGEARPSVLDFHHIDENDKIDHVGNIKSLKLIVEEVKKCVVLCANCHRQFHYEDANNLPLTVIF